MEDVNDQRASSVTGSTQVDPEFGRLLHLGFRDDVYYCFSPVRKDIVSLRAREHTEANLLMLLPPEEWVKRHPLRWPDQDRYDFPRARSELMRACHEVGHFDPDRVRGRGVWWEDGLGAVVNDGAELAAEGLTRPLGLAGGGIYVSAKRWPGLLDAAPLAAGACGPLLELLDALPWRHPAHARLLAGWLALAGVCGGLPWRPHLAVTGPPQAGKSWLVDNVIAPLLRPAVLEVVGPTSEAGLRQTLGGDARPVVWDEARPEGRRGHVRFEEVMTFGRHLSSGREAAVIKGGKDHRPRPFTGTGVLCLAARQLPPRPADRDRVTAVALAAGGRDDRRAAAALALLDEAFARGLFVRMVRLLPALRASHEVFARTGDERRGPRPAGNQLGALLAGAWHLEHDRAPTAAEAAARYRELPDGLVGPVRSRAAGERCLEVLARYRVGPGTVGKGQAGSLALGELAGLALGVDSAGGGVGAKEAYAVLRRLGVLVLAEEREVAVANKHRGLAAILAGTEFAAGWGAALGSLPGARTMTRPLWFGAEQSRAVVLPADLMLEGGPRASGEPGA